MLRATHSVLRPGAAIGFYVIANARDLTEADRERLAQRDGNEHVESRRPYDILMQEAGFVDIELKEVTSQYIETVTAWKRAWEHDADAFVELLGEAEFARRIRNRVLDVANAEDGLIGRYRVYGTRP